MNSGKPSESSFSNPAVSLETNPLKSIKVDENGNFIKAKPQTDVYYNSPPATMSPNPQTDVYYNAPPAISSPAVPKSILKKSSSVTFGPPKAKKIETQTRSFSFLGRIPGLIGKGTDEVIDAVDGAVDDVLPTANPVNDLTGPPVADDVLPQLGGKQPLGHHLGTENGYPLISDGNGGMFGRRADGTEFHRTRQGNIFRNLAIIAGDIIPEGWIPMNGKLASVVYEGVPIPGFRPTKETIFTGAGLLVVASTVTLLSSVVNSMKGGVEESLKPPWWPEGAYLPLDDGTCANPNATYDEVNQYCIVRPPQSTATTDTGGLPMSGNTGGFGYNPNQGAQDFFGQFQQQLDGVIDSAQNNAQEAYYSQNTSGGGNQVIPPTDPPGSEPPVSPADPTQPPDLTMEQKELNCYLACCTQYGNCGAQPGTTTTPVVPGVGEPGGPGGVAAPATSQCAPCKGEKPPPAVFVYQNLDGEVVYSLNPKPCKVTDLVNKITTPDGYTHYIRNTEPMSVIENGQDFTYEAYAIGQDIIKGTNSKNKGECKPPRGYSNSVSSAGSSKKKPSRGRGRKPCRKPHKHSGSSSCSCSTKSSSKKKPPRRKPGRGSVSSAGSSKKKPPKRRPGRGSGSVSSLSGASSKKGRFCKKPKVCVLPKKKPARRPRGPSKKELLAQLEAAQAQSSSMQAQCSYEPPQFAGYSNVNDFDFYY